MRRPWHALGRSATKNKYTLYIYIYCVCIHIYIYLYTLYIYKLANSMKESPWETNELLTGQELPQLKASSAKQLRTAPFWIVTQPVVVISYRRFGTTCRSHLQGSRIQKKFLTVYIYIYCVWRLNTYTEMHWGFQEQGPEGNQGTGSNKKLRKIT